MLAHAQTVAHAVGQSSRYHGYKDPSAPVCLEFRIDKSVMLTDNTSDTLSKYSLQMPRNDYR